MRELYFTVLATVLNVALPYVITRVDRARLDPVHRARAWNGASWASAVYFFGPLSLPAHFWVTRQTILGLLVGGFWCGVVLGFEALVASLLDYFVS